MKGYSAFANKVWNAARFVLMNLKEQDAWVDPDAVDRLLSGKKEAMPLEDLWILHRLNRVSGEISESLDKFRFHEASALIYQFIWHELCDWYIELVKPVLTDPAAGSERGPRVQVLVHTLDFALRLLHPFMPFLTEEIWQKIPHRGESIMIQEFPSHRAARENPEAARRAEDLMDLIGQIRSLRAEVNIDPRRSLDSVLVIPNPADKELVLRNLEKIRSLARLHRVEFSGSLAGNLLRGVWRLGEFGLDVHDAINVAAERERLQKEMARVREEIDRIWQKINSREFVSRAPDAIVAENRTRHEELTEKLRKLESSLGHLPLQ
jgi:valyl-tRNA synthetase